MSTLPLLASGITWFVLRVHRREHPSSDTPASPPVRRFYPLQDSDTVGYFTVLSPGCSPADLSSALTANSPLAALNATLAAEAAQQLNMTARLAAVQPLLRTLLAEPSPSITVPGLLNASSPVLWIGATMALCYTLPASGNVSPKGLTLFIGPDMSGSYYANALGPAASPLPAGAQACLNVSLPATIPTGTYTIGMQDSTTGAALAALTFSAGNGNAFFSGLVNGALSVTVTVSWTIDAPHASPADVMQVVNSAGTAVFWFYTSCLCQTPPGPGAAAATSGGVSFQIVKAGAVKGGYTPRLLPGGGSLAARTGPNWIPWAALGL